MKKSILFSLAAILLICSLLLFSCDKKDSGGKAKENEDKVLIDDGSIFYDRAVIDDEVETVDYGGRDFRIVTHMETEFNFRETKEIC